MGFKKIQVKVKNKRGAGVDQILATFKENYESWMEGIKEMEEVDKQELIDAFDSALTGSGDAVTSD